MVRSPERSTAVLQGTEIVCQCGLYVTLKVIYTLSLCHLGTNSLLSSSIRLDQEADMEWLLPQPDCTQA